MPFLAPQVREHCAKQQQDVHQHDFRSPEEVLP